MNKKFSTQERFFISLVGPSGFGQSQLVFDLLKIGTFEPKFDKMFFLINIINLIKNKCKEKNLNLYKLMTLNGFKILLNNGTKYLLIFDDSCEKISNSKQFVKVATAGRHRGLNTIYIRHNLFHQSRLGRDN